MALTLSFGIMSLKNMCVDKLISSHYDDGPLIKSKFNDISYIIDTLRTYQKLKSLSFYIHNKGYFHFKYNCFNKHYLMVETEKDNIINYKNGILDIDKEIYFKLDHLYKINTFIEFEIKNIPLINFHDICSSLSVEKKDIYKIYNIEIILTYEYQVTEDEYEDNEILYNTNCIILKNGNISYFNKFNKIINEIDYGLEYEIDNIRIRNDYKISLNMLNQIIKFNTTK